MLRTFLFGLLALGILPAGVATAGEGSHKASQHHMQGTITKIDTQDNSIVLKQTDKTGKEKDHTLQLAQHAKLEDAGSKELKLDAFKPGDAVCAVEKDGKITELKMQSEATITNVNPKAGTVTVQMTDKNGKTIDRTFHLVGDTIYVDSTGRIVESDIFRSGDRVLFVEAEGNIKSMTKSNRRQDQQQASRASGKTEK